jgi:DNA mismatch repair ATPase MutL
MYNCVKLNILLSLGMNECSKGERSCHKEGSNSSQVKINDYLPKTSQIVVDKSVFKECEVLMIAQNSYIVIHHKGNIYMVDQHAAGEKILYM